MNTTIKPPLSARRVPRLSGWAVITVVLLIAILLLAPHQLKVSIYKLSLVTMAAVVGYWLDRSLFPYARPDSFGPQLEDAILADEDAIEANGGHQDILVSVSSSTDLLFAAAMIRRALIVGAAMLAMGLGA